MLTAQVGVFFLVLLLEVKVLRAPGSPLFPGTLNFIATWHFDKER